VVISRNPTTLQLRYLQTLTEIANEKTNTIIFPLPIEFMKAFSKMALPAEGDTPKEEKPANQA
jgi:hypothetical protein